MFRIPMGQMKFHKRVKV